MDDDTILAVLVALGAVVLIDWWRQQSTAGGQGFAFSPTAPNTARGAIDIIAPLSVSPEGEAFIKSYETLHLTRYSDAGKPAIGWGHDIRPGDNIGQSITKPQADTLFNQDIATTAQTINRLVTVGLTQTQFDALADLVYNIGPGQFASSQLLRMVNARNFQGAAQQFKRWVYSQGKVNPKMVQRRNQGAAAFTGTG